MNKFIKVLLIIFWIISIIWCVFNVGFFLHRRDWVVATATITFVGLPDGAVIGAYTDADGNVHKDVALYIDYFHQGYGADVDNMIGKEVSIIYNPITGETNKNNGGSVCVSVIFLMLTVIIIIFFNKKNRK